MLRADWTEELRCPICGKTGVAGLSQDNEAAMPTVQSLPNGFKVVARRYAPNFECGARNVPVVP